jgi:hypothetical protein
MTTALKQSQTSPPAPTAMSVRAHGKTLALKIDALRAGAGQLALGSARGQPGAQSALAALDARIRALEYELSLNPQAVELARQEDAAAEAAWRSNIQMMDPDEIIEGITRDSCCRRCVPGGPNGCVITSPASHSGGVCGHPVTQKHLWFRDQTGHTHFPYEDTARAMEIHMAACRRLKVSPV